VSHSAQVLAMLEPFLGELVGKRGFIKLVGASTTPTAAAARRAQVSAQMAAGVCQGPLVLLLDVLALRSGRGCVGAGVGREGGGRGARLWRVGRRCRGTPQQAICRSRGAELVKGRRPVRLQGYTSGRGGRGG
jgi:hypothetical protein